MKRGAAFLVVALCLFAPALFAQSADSIIEKHLKAIGGKKALGRIAGTQLRGSVDGPAGPVGTFRWETRRPDREYLEVQNGSHSFIEASNGKTAWREDAAEGLRTLTGREQLRARAAAFLHGDRFLNYKKEKTGLQLAGRETLDGRAAFVVRATTRTGVQRKLYFDAQTYLLLKESGDSEGVSEELAFADYRPVEGVLEPHRITLRRGADVFRLAVEEAAHPRAADEKVFDFPARSGAPLSDISALLAEVTGNQRTIDAIVENYTYTLKEIRLEIDGKGNIKTKEEEEYEVFYLGRRQVRKLMARNGKPLSPAEQQKVEKQIEKTIREYEELKKIQAQREAERQRRAARGESAGRESQEDVGISDFLRAMQLVNPRRERFRGQEVIVFEFEPRPGFKPRNRAESLIQKLTGAVWVDERERQVARLEARLLDNYRVGGGLVASLHKGSAFLFEQERVNNEVWLPRYAEVNASARVLLLAGMKFHLVHHYSNYKKFRVESTYEVKPPPPN